MHVDSLNVDCRRARKDLIKSEAGCRCDNIDSARRDTDPKNSPFLTKSAFVRSCEGAPKRRSARITASALSGPGAIHMSIAMVARGYPCAASD
jgi:hypothetical protein